MEFNRTSEQELIYETARDIASSYPEEYWQKVREEYTIDEFRNDLADGGWLGITIPEEYGGEGMGMLELVTLIEGMSKGGGWEAVGPLVIDIGIITNLLKKFGSEAQKESHLPKIANGEEQWSFGVTEPDAGLNTANIATSAERVGDEFMYVFTPRSRQPAQREPVT
ncbi:hypothetical protein JCM31271_31390 [Halorubrum trueperi]